MVSQHIRTGTKKVTVINSSQEKGGTQCHLEPHGKAPGLVRRHKEQGESIGKSILVSFHRKGKVKEGRLDYLDHFSRLWGINTVSSCLAPGPGMIRAKEYCLLELKSQIKEVVLSMNSGLIRLHVHSTLTGESSAISRN